MGCRILIVTSIFFAGIPFLSHAQSEAPMEEKCSKGSAMDVYDCISNERKLRDEKLSSIVKHIRDHYSYIKIDDYQTKWRRYVDAWCQGTTTLAHWDGGSQAEGCLIKHIDSRINEIYEYFCDENGCPQPDR
jgi:hypothetical protein